jgi:hypothetical protein
MTPSRRSNLPRRHTALGGSRSAQLALQEISVGFSRLGLGEAAEALARWRRSVVSGIVSVEDGGTFPDCLGLLELLVGGARPRELLLEVSGGWTGYFDCLLRGTDAVSTIGYLAGAIGCQGLAITSVPHTAGRPGAGHGQFGAVQFEMFGPLRTEFMNYVRTVSAAYDGSRWMFSAAGTVQWFEETEAYKARRVRDRFTSQMLERYCRALDLEVFDPASYGPRSVLVRSEVPVPPGSRVMSLQQAQHWLQIVPGAADQIPG